MKTPNQVSRKNSGSTKSAQPPKVDRALSGEQPKSAGKKRVRFLVQKPFGEAIKRGAKRLDLSVSQFVERAIREKLPAAAQIVSSGNPSAIAAMDRGRATIEQLPRDATSAQIRAAKRKLRSIVAGVTPSKKQRVRQSKTSRPIVHRLATPVPVEYPQALRSFWRRNVAPARWFDPQKEHLVTVIFDTRLRAVAFSLISIGFLDQAIAHPREVLRPVLDQAGYAFAVLHNHPSGVPSPSDTDHALTRRLIDSAEVLQLRFVDHVIVGADRDYFSFNEAGVIGDGNTSAIVRDKADLKIAPGEQSKQKDPLLALEDAVASTSGLLEALSYVLETSATGKYAPLSDRAVDGLRTLACAQVEQLHRSFDGYHACRKRADLS